MLSETSWQLGASCWDHDLTSPLTHKGHDPVENSLWLAIFIRTLIFVYVKLRLGQRRLQLATNQLCFRVCMLKFRLYLVSRLLRSASSHQTLVVFEEYTFYWLFTVAQAKRTRLNNLSDCTKVACDLFFTILTAILFKTFAWVLIELLLRVAVTWVFLRGHFR